jgi:hypothetical protein
MRWRYVVRVLLMVIYALQSGLASHTIKCCLQVERQIDQMVSFIKQEAEEKANEISVSAEEV